MIDHHIHSLHSGDAVSTVREMCAGAVQIGLDEIIFTEHLDFTPTDPTYGAFDYEPWFKDILKAREEFDGKLIIRAGVEVDYRKEFHNQIEDYLSSHKFDYILGSVHYVGDLLLEEHHEQYFTGKTSKDAYAPYLENALTAVEAGLFETLGHLDLCKRYGVRYYGAFQLDEHLAIIEEILTAVINRKMMLEINTSGLRQSPKETYPGPDTIALYKSLGGDKFALGSDAHKAEDVAAGFTEAAQLIRG